jgi:hypothetical protein
VFGSPAGKTVCCVSFILNTPVSYSAVYAGIAVPPSLSPNPFTVSNNWLSLLFCCYVSIEAAGRARCASGTPHSFPAKRVSGFAKFRRAGV